MNKMTKQIMIYSLAGIMQLGLGVTTVEASPLHIEGTQSVVQLDVWSELKDILRDKPPHEPPHEHPPHEQPPQKQATQKQPPQQQPPR